MSLTLVPAGSVESITISELVPGSILTIRTSCHEQVWRVLRHGKESSVLSSGASQSPTSVDYIVSSNMSLKVSRRIPAPLSQKIDRIKSITVETPASVA